MGLRSTETDLGASKVGQAIRLFHGRLKARPNNASRIAGRVFGGEERRRRKRNLIC